MSYTSKVVQDKKALIKQDGDNNKDSQKQKRDYVLKNSLPGCDYLDQISGKDFEHICYSDIYFCCELYSLRKYKNEYINDSLDACNAQIKEVLDTPAQIKPIDKKDPLFVYERLCDEKYDLTEEEKSFLWIINGIKDSLGFGLGRLYSTTKVFLGVSNGKIKETEWNDEDDPLGYYTKNSSEYSGPQVWLIMDKITAEAERLCLEREYIIAKVYIHEMMHRSFDLRPDWGQKPYVREIEEPMAEFATLKFIEELSKQSATFEKLLPIALVMTEGLRKSMKHFIYALGVDLYYKAPIKLIFDFRRISMLLHKSGVDCEIDGKKLDLDPSPMKYVDEYVALCTTDQDLRKLVGPIKECIETYAKFFPLNKGIQ